MKVLYICTHNRCRSIMAEAITNQLGRDRLHAASAGSQPAGEVHPHSLNYLARAGYTTKDLHSKSWGEVKDFDSDLVITLCDSAAGEACPLWMQDSLKVHWGLKDPSREDGDDTAVAVAFEATIRELEERTRALLQLRADYKDSAQLRPALFELGAH